MFKFKYNNIGEINADNGLFFQYTLIKRIIRPMIKIKIKGKTNKDCDFLLDTGSPYNLLNTETAVRIGIDTTKDGEPIFLSGIGGYIECKKTWTRIRIGNNPDFPITFYLSPNVPNILGIWEDSILSKFAIVFDKDKFGLFLTG